jgi:amino acid adenylation domain-containing protein
MRASDYSEDIAISAGQNIKERDYWLDKLSGELVRHGFPYDVERTAAAKKERSIETVKFVFPGELCAKLMKLRSGSDPRLYMILTAGLIVLLDKYTYNRNKWNKDIIVGTPVFKQEVEGEFINTVLALRNRLDDHMTFKELLLRVRQTIIEAAENQNYPIETLLYKLNIPDSRDDFTLFDIAVLLGNIHDKGYLGDIKLSMVFSFSRTGETVEGELEYNALLYKKETAARIINHLENLLQGACFDVNVRLSDIDILSQREKEQLLFEFNDNRVEFAGDKTVYRFIEEYAEKAPDRAAVVYCDDVDTYAVTYGELNRRADRLAGVLRDNGICRDQPVGILLHRSFAMVVSILAAWKAGGAYIPIDPAYPVQRIDNILADSTAPVLITQSRHVEPGLADRYRGKIIRPDCRTGEKENRLAGNSDLPVNAHSLAYVIYTSGSTGKPKGAMVEHIGMMNHIRAKIGDLQITAESIVAQNSSHTFDISVWQFFTALVKGGKTVIYTNELVLDTEGFIARIIKDKITILEVVPSYLAVILENLPVSLFLPPDYLLVTGETVKPGLVKKWFERYPGIKMVNAYGPTEASDDITHHIMDKAPDLERVPIGKSLQNFNIYIVDENMELSPIGVKGEICVSGLGVGRGYLNNPELTAGKCLFFSYKSYRTYRTYRSKKIYRTGDLGRWLPDGTIDFFGRKDYQVKIRGYRIELGEIESKLVNHPRVKEAVVMDKEVGGHKYLCAFLVVDGASRLDVTGIKDYLSGSLPAYMVPAYFVRLEKMPLTPNGKIDRKSLPEPEIAGAAGEHIPPGNKMEEKLAEIWGEVLQVDKERIGIDANFFEFGGHSLRATVLVSRLHKEFNVKVPLTEVFKTPTIRELAGYLKRSAQDKYSSIEPAPGKDYYALSPAQKRLYVLQQMDLESIGYNVPGIVEFEEKPDKERLENALEELVRRHESLRTSFVVIDDEPVQEINDVRELELGI